MNIRVWQIIETLFGAMVALEILRTAARRHPTGWDLLEYGLLLWCAAAPVVTFWWRRQQLETDPVFRQTVIYLTTCLFIGTLTALQLK